MELNVDFEPVYPHHDLLIELGQVEMAIDRLTSRTDFARGSEPGLESRLHNLLDALDHLPV